jgi:hypothetical protein
VLSVKEFLAQKLITEMKHPLLSPDLVLNDFWPFPKIKPSIKGRRFQDIEDIQKKKVTCIPKCFHQWQHCGAKCIAAQGEYFECGPS